MNIIKKYLPAQDWKENFQALLHLKVLNLFDVFVACSVMLGVITFEILTVTTFIPLIEYLQNGADISFDKKSIWMQYYYKVYNFFGITPNILTLSLSRN